MNGHSLVPVLKGEEEGWRTSIFTEFNMTSGARIYTMRAIENRQFRYIYNPWSQTGIKMQMESMAGLTWSAMVQAGKSDPDIQERVELFSYRVLEELFDVQKDPDALDNLIDDPVYEDILTELRQELANEMYTTLDTVLPRFEDEFNITGEEVTAGCLDQEFEEYNAEANRHDHTLCRTLAVNPGTGPGHRGPLDIHSWGFTLPAGLEKRPVQITDIYGRKVSCERENSGTIRFRERTNPGVYLIRIGDRVYKQLLKG
jgi:hypothetical protein